MHLMDDETKDINNSETPENSEYPEYSENSENSETTENSEAHSDYKPVNRCPRSRRR